MPTLELIEDDAPSFLLNKPKKDFDQLSKEEKKAWLDRLSSEVNPSQLEQLAAQVLNQDDTVNVQPQAGYVCKTRVVECQSNSKYAKGTLVYINICYAPEIPAPPIADEKEIERALNAEPGASYQVPLSMGQPRTHSNGALVMDACINTQPYLKSEKNLDFRLYLLELAMEYVEDIVAVSLSREFTMPSVPSIGKIPSRLLKIPAASPSLLVSNEKSKPQEHVMWPESGFLKMVIPIRDTHASSLAVDVTANQLILNGSSYDLSHPILVHDPNNKVEFYQKSRDLVVQLKLSSP
ncbi:PIH1 domain-containing protein 1 [Choanephora cucurbitarum]|uniref:PIH1 domain-containing protein 1 n=1 Tax=Choanephora cucurbitarum TaxID=101091 RepID=A0A1C7NF19_9FUNG|nr:PIH1 domain-containing protein 1 [Choanephora cucurbitarum]